jgi:hypothetical protein
MSVAVQSGLAEFRLFDVALTDNQVDLLYQSFASEFLGYGTLFFIFYSSSHPNII